MEITELVERLERVERDNQRLKLALGAVMLVLAAVPLIGAVMPEQVPRMALGPFLLLLAAVPLVGAVIANGIPELIQARQFEVIDEDGTMRVLIDEDGIFYCDENGTYRAAINENGIHYQDENGNAVWRTP